MILTLAVSGAAFAQHDKKAEGQELNSKGEPIVKVKDNTAVALKTGEKITRGAAFTSGAKKATVAKALKNPAKYEGKTVALKGTIVRSCKMEGCWMELGDKKGGKSVRVTFGDHKFFIPLNAAGMDVKAQGVFKTKTLTKEHVDHLINEDGAKFPNRNADGTVTEVSFDATGVELTKVG